MNPERTGVLSQFPSAFVTPGIVLGSVSIAIYEVLILKRLSFVDEKGGASCCALETRARVVCDGRRCKLFIRESALSTVSMLDCCLLPIVPATHPDRAIGVAANCRLLLRAEVTARRGEQAGGRQGEPSKLEAAYRRRAKSSTLSRPAMQDQ